MDGSVALMENLIANEYAATQNDDDSACLYDDFMRLKIYLESSGLASGLLQDLLMNV